MNDKPILRMKLDLNEFTNLNNSYDAYMRINLSKYNIDRIYNIYSQFSSKVQFFEKNIKFQYNTINKELTLMDNVKIITIDFASVVEERELKLKELGI
jgi:hypothetical protein